MSAFKIFEYTNVDTEEVIELDLPMGELAIYSRPRPGEDSRINEDSALALAIDDTQGVLVVADGLGGHRGGAEASKTACHAIIESLSDNETHLKSSLREAILNGIELAHHKIRSQGIGAGTTITVCELSHGNARFYSVGDSVSLLYSGQGTTKYKSVEHSPIGFAVEAGMVEEHTALTHEDAHLVSYVLGTTPIHIDMSGAIEISKRDMILMCTDGLTSNFTHSQIADQMGTGTPAERLQQLVLASVEKMDPVKGLGKPDDLTMIMFRSKYLDDSKESS